MAKVGSKLGGALSKMPREKAMERLSPGVYRGAQGGLVTSSGRALPRQNAPQQTPPQVPPARRPSLEVPKMPAPINFDTIRSVTGNGGMIDNNNINPGYMPPGQGGSREDFMSVINQAGGPPKQFLLGQANNEEQYQSMIDYNRTPPNGNQFGAQPSFNYFQPGNNQPMNGFNQNMQFDQNRQMQYMPMPFNRYAK